MLGRELYRNLGFGGTAGFPVGVGAATLVEPEFDEERGRLVMCSLLLTGLLLFPLRPILDEPSL